MTFWTLERLGTALADCLESAPPGGSGALGNICTDSRALQAGDVFVALRGDRFDGHDFVRAVAEREASALVVSDARVVTGTRIPMLLVRDTTEALGRLGAWRRSVWGGVTVAVAGSNGKTSTRHLIEAALGSRFRVHATSGNLNNQIGVPLTLLAIPDAAEIAVVEIGTNHPGEVAPLRDLVAPDIAVVTSVGEEHLEGLGDLAGVLAEEASVCAGVDLAVVPSSQPEIAKAVTPLARRVIEAGLDHGAVRADTWGLHADGRGWAVLGDVRLESPLVGAHNLRNALLAVAVARACGVADADAARGIAEMAMPPMRSALSPVGTMLVLNDAYNANPASAREALAMIEAIAGRRPTVVVLGSMLELGAQSPALHDDIARQALAGPARVVAGIGEFAAAFGRVAPGDPRVITGDDALEVWPRLKPRIPPDALILLKGSRGTRLERLMPLLHELAGVTAPVPSMPH